MAGHSIQSVLGRAVVAGLVAGVLTASTAPVVGAGSPPRIGHARRAISPVGTLVRFRPTDGGQDPQGSGYSVPSRHVCGPHLCVHWVSSTDDAPPLSDANGNGLPDQVDRTLSTFEAAWAFEIGKLGFRPPMSDAASRNHGPDGRLDIYLADIGRVDLDGYVATDDPHSSDNNYAYRNYSAYIVVDDDFSTSQLGSTGGFDGLRVTAAHELFHAVQYAYDAGEDGWLMEGTAAWMEDQFADDVNTDRAWLRQSPLTQPWIPVDSSEGLHEYGAWIFWRYLSESMGSGTSDTSIIRRIWELAADRPGAPNLFSARAVEVALHDRGRGFGGVLAAFGSWNVAPAAFYREGVAYPRAPIVRSFRLDGHHAVTGWSTIRLNHLATAAVSFAPAIDAPMHSWLRVMIDAPPSGDGSGARVMIEQRSGVIREIAVTLDRRGDADLRLPFGRQGVSRIVVVMANASTNFDCWTGAGYSCNGRSHADQAPFSYVASLIR